ncbi:hypothetical protein [Synechococcus elongatus]
MRLNSIIAFWMTAALVIPSAQAADTRLINKLCIEKTGNRFGAQTERMINMCIGHYESRADVANCKNENCVRKLMLLPVKN